MPRPARPRLSAILLGSWQALLLGLLALLLRYAWIHETTDPLRVAGQPAQALSVRPGQGAASIAEELVSTGLLERSTPFRVLVFVRGDGARLQAGDYVFDGTLSLEGLVDKLVRGEVARYEVTFPEGRTLEDMAELAAARGVDRDAFLKAARDPQPIRDLDPAAKDLEGYLFPDTYDVGPRPDAARLVARMLTRFRSVVEPERPRLAEKKLDVRQLVTLASIVEVETGRADERPRIAAVFLNRLARGMPLQTDPTVIYALRLKGAWDGNIRKADLKIDSPYNTYRYPGLPPGPIASPGRDAIRAVLDPAPVKDLYFVSRNDGSHEFSETLAAHESAVTRFQRRRGRR
jgi:UPF0755 protein